MNRLLTWIAGVLLIGFFAAGAHAEEYKGVAIKSVKTDLKSTPAEHIITITSGKKEVVLRFSKDMKAYTADGKEVPAGNLVQVFANGNTVDLKTEKDGDVERIIEAKLVKKGAR